MPKFSAHLAWLFNEVDFPNRFERAAKAGFAGVEYPFPEGVEKERLVELLGKYQLEQVLLNLPRGKQGEIGIACLSGRETEFQEGVGRAIDYAKALRCTRVNCLVGNAPPGVPSREVRQTVVQNLRFAATALGNEGIRLLVESVNSYENPGFYLSRTVDALSLVADVAHPNLWLQYDIYHMQIMEGNLTKTIRDNVARLAHMQLGDVPGRHEPGTGEINFANLFRFIDEAGYDGWIGCEYKPAGVTEEGLGWVRPYLGRKGAK
ncbi:MAG: TIM barrel protein [Chloroflexi bacterium]|nr:TIM barrel protein [Chloroflexota bacterium]